MSFEAHGSVEGSTSEQPVMEGGVIPEVSKPEAASPAPETPALRIPKTPKVAPEAPAPEVPAYTPNWKFKVMNQEHEIPEWARGAIKDPEIEKQAREIWEKAHGLDAIKPRFQDLKTKYQEATHEVANFKRSVGELKEHYQRGDMDSFFKTLNVPQEKILQWVLDKANYEQLPPEHRQVLDAKRAAEQQAYNLQKENKSLQQQREEVELHARAQTLQVALEKPDVSEFAKSFETRAGKPGSFIEEIISHGERVFYASKGKIDLTPEQAIKEVMDRWSPFVSPQPTQPPIIPANPGMNGAAPQPTRAPAAPKAPTIPNVTGRQTAAVSNAKPKSIADLKELYRKKAGLA